MVIARINCLQVVAGQMTVNPRSRTRPVVRLNDPDAENWIYAQMYWRWDGKSVSRLAERSFHDVFYLLSREGVLETYWRLARGEVHANT